MVQLGQTPTSQGIFEEIADVFVHPDFKYPRAYNDIGLIRLNRKIQFTKGIRAACLSTDNEISDNSSQLIVTGWGYEVGNDLRQTEQIQRGLMKVINDEYCASKLGTDIFFPKGVDKKTQICAEYLSPSNRNCSVSIVYYTQREHVFTHK